MLFFDYLLKIDKNADDSEDELNSTSNREDVFEQHCALLLAIASRCRKGMATTVDAEAIEEIVRQAREETQQIQNQSA